MDSSWKELFVDSTYNSVVAATASEGIQSSLTHRNEFAPFNRLLVSNRDKVPIKLYLDGLDIAGKYFQLSAGEVMLIEPTDGITFTFLKQENLHATDAETANLILFRWAKCAKVE